MLLVWRKGLKRPSSPPGTSQRPDFQGPGPALGSWESTVAGSTPQGARGPRDDASKRAHVRRRTGWLLTAVGVIAQVVLVTGLIGSVATNAFAGPPAAMTGFVPLPADQMVTAFKAINSAAGTTLDFTVGVTVASDGAVVYYDTAERPSGS